MINKEKRRLNEVFNNFYYKDLSNTNSKNKLQYGHVTDMLNDFLVLGQIIFALIYNGKDDLPNMKILDAGCGNGRMLRKMCELGAKPDNCDGVDLSNDVINFAELNSPPGIWYDVEDIKSMTYINNYFDIILNMGVLIHIKDNDYIKDIAKEFYRVLKPGGIVFITVAHEGVTWKNEITQSISRTFTIDEITGLFDMFECQGIYNAYSDNYKTDSDIQLRYSHIMNAFETNTIDANYKLIVLKK